MNESESYPAPPLVDPQTGGIAINILCHACAYNLRGLPVDGRCPECAAPIRETLCAAQAETASPRWISALQTGIALTANGSGAILAGLLTGAAATLAGPIFGPVPGVVLVRPGFVMNSLLAGGAVILVIAGCVLLFRGLHFTALPPPGQHAPRLAEPFRRRARAGEATFWCTLLLGVPLGCSGNLWAAKGAVMLCASVFLAWGYFHARYLEKLAETWRWANLRAAARTVTPIWAAAVVGDVLLLTLPTPSWPRRLWLGAVLLAILAFTATSASAYVSARLHTRFLAALDHAAAERERRARSARGDGEPMRTERADVS